MRLVLVTSIAVLMAAPFAPAAGLSVQPTSLKIRGSDDAPQLIISEETHPGRFVDRTADVQYAVGNARIARVDRDGRVYPLANGNTAIVISHNGRSLTVPVQVESMETPLPINFTNQIEPILTKLSCNSGGCHGKIAGQNGFRLSLLGFEPEFDYMTLVKEGRGRRLFPSAPDQSLFLLKASGTMPHGGGIKMKAGSEEYKILRRWIASGLPYGSPSDPTITRVSVFPESRIIDRSGRQQLAVYAHYSDGSSEDVTRRAQFESNDTEVATVDDAGLVHTLDRTGQSAIMVRFSGAVTVFRAVVPRPGTAVAFDFPPKTVVDTHTAKKWHELNIVPSPTSSDEQFIRRAYLDITGTLPQPEAITKFAADTDPAKRDKLIDRLVETPEYSFFFANKWADVLRVKRRNQPDRAIGTFAFHNWIREAMATDKPYDDFARAIVTAIGDESKSPPTVWYKEVTTPENFVDDVSQVFLGQRLACANCHHHPYEKWTQDDYWGIAAFFARVGRKTTPVPGAAGNNRRSQELVIFTRSSGSVTNKRTNRAAEMKALESEPQTATSDEDPRHLFADWMTDPKNPFFAHAVANRYWAHFFGRGIVDPIDDMRVTNPPSNPALLDALAADLVKNQYSLKSLIKTICKSRTYGLSAEPNAWNQSDKQSYARYYPKRLQAEVVFDAVCAVTEAPPTFNGLPRDAHAPNRAIQLPDESYSSYFLDVFGRPQRISACECERVNEASLAMTLHMLNSNEVQGMIAGGSGRAARLAKDPRPDDVKVTELFLLTVGKAPTPEQLTLARNELAKHEKDKKPAYENIIWALLNTKAFLFNQ